MKYMFTRGIVPVCIAGLILACNSNKGETTTTATIDKEKIKQEIQAKEDSFAAVYNSGVPRNIGYYAEDAISYFQNRLPLIGKQAIIDFLYTGLTAGYKIIYKTDEVFPSSDGNLVLEIGSFGIKDSTNTPINAGYYMTLFEKRDGHYYALRDMSVSNGQITPD